MRDSLLIFAAVLFTTVGALDCPSSSLKITIADSTYDFNDYENYELRATIAYSLQKYCGGELEAIPTPSCEYNNMTAKNVHLEDITERIAMCVIVDLIDPNAVRMAIRGSKANLNGALLLTDQELLVAGIQPTLSPITEPDFPYWLIAYIVIFGLVLLGGLAILIYAKCHKNEKDEDEKSILEADIERDSSTDDGLPVELDDRYKVNESFSVEEEKEGTLTML